MSSTARLRPIIATSIGEPAGVGAEIVAKAWATGEVHKLSRPVLIGSQHAMRRGMEIAGVRAELRVIGSLDDLSDRPEIIDIMDSGALSAGDIITGKDTLAGGLASAKWMSEADALARSGKAAASVFAPISSGSLKMANKLDAVMPINPGESYLFLMSGPLRVMHLTDHMPLRKVCEVISEDLALSALQTLDATMRKWGVAAPRIIVAGLNPHAMGQEEVKALVPAVLKARAAGINVEGPTSPDAVFRQCVEGKYDVVLAMYHDQGHIAIKTWGFSGNCAIIIGPPYLNMTVAHGTAYDIAGKGIADPKMMLSAMCTAASLAAGAGFIREPS
ncbi:MAG: 4-hydroxythreonine-4-phosphate dehydrogenase PdxA [Alphaproteobacteria bacterium]